MMEEESNVYKYRKSYDKPVKHSVVALICAAGKSTRTREIGVMQKACAVVRWNGQVKPMVLHQIDSVRGKVDEIYVALGWMAEDVKACMRRYGVNDVKIFYDRKIEGLGMLWKQFVDRRPHYKGNILSINVDDLHYQYVFDNMAEVGVGMVNVNRIYGRLDSIFSLKGKTAYEVEGGYVKGVKGKYGMVKADYVGSGIYMLNADDLRDVYYVKNNGEYDPDSVIASLISNGVKLKAHLTGVWFDGGNPEILKDILVSE